MAKYKVGDRVRVKSWDALLKMGNLHATGVDEYITPHTNDDAVFVYEMKEYIGSVGRVTAVHKVGRSIQYSLSFPCMVCGWAFCEWMLEPVNEEKKPVVHDAINPSHYKQFSVETIDMMVAIWGKEKVADHCEITAFKYALRMGYKDPLEQDAKKRDWYLAKAQELRGN